MSVCDVSVLSEGASRVCHFLLPLAPLLIFLVSLVYRLCYSLCPIPILGSS